MMRRESAFSNEPQTVGDLMTAPDTDTLIALAREGRIAVVPVGDNRPADCRHRLQEEGKPYPRSSCKACGKGIMTGLGKACTVSASPTLTPALLALAEERDRLREALAKVRDRFFPQDQGERERDELWDEVNRALTGDTP